MSSLLARITFPLALMVGAGLWIGAYASIGDGFSAGMVAGLGAALQFVCRGHEEAARAVGAKAAWPMLVAGLALSLLVILVPTLLGAPPVTHVPAPGAHVPAFGGVEVHTAVLFDLGVALVVYGGLVGIFDRLFPPEKGADA